MNVIKATLLLTTVNLSLAAASGTPPDILFIVIDDTGIDQWASFGWDAEGAQRAPFTPVLDAITSSGVAFTNCWAMPECSPSRAAFFQVDCRCAQALKPRSRMGISPPAS